MRVLSRLTVPLVLVSLLFVSCGQRGPFVPDLSDLPNPYDSLSFDDGIQTILTADCGGCHTGFGPDPASWSAVSNYVVPGSSAASLLVIKGSGGNGHGGGVILAGTDLDKVKYWIDHNQAVKSSSTNPWDSLTFGNGIQALLTPNCAGCHTGFGPDPSNWSAVSNYVVPGNSATSPLAIKAGGGNSHGGGVVLSGTNLDKLKYWIDQDNAAR